LKVRVPFREVLNGRQQAGGAGGIEVGDAQLECLTLPRVAVRLVFHDFRKVVAEVRVGHAQRFEDPLVGELPERLAARAAHNHGKQRVAAVGVEMLLARREVEVLLARQQREHVVIGDEVARVAPAGKSEQRPLVADAAGVMDQMADCDALAEVRQFRHVLPDVVVQRQLAVLGEQQDGHGGELL
jgi:hypothetical protein